MSEKLGEFVKRIRNEKRLSVADVSERSNKKISTSYINKIENEPNVNPSYPKIQALAKGLGASEEELFAIVRGLKPDEARIKDQLLFDIAHRYKALSNLQKVVIEPLLKAFEQAVLTSWNKNLIDVSTILNRIGKDYGISFEILNFYTAVVERKEKNLDTWYINPDEFPEINISRWISQEINIQMWVETTFFRDSDQIKFERELRKAIKFLLKIPVLTSEYMSDVFKSKTYKKLEKAGHFSYESYVISSFSDLKDALKLGHRYFRLISLDHFENLDEKSNNKSKVDKTENLDGKELAPSSKRKIPLDEGIEESKSKAS